MFDLKSTFILFFLLIFCENNLKSDIVINEIQAAPVGNEPEWLELYNPSSLPVNLTLPYINDAVSAKKLPDLYIPADSYAIITKDTSALLKCRKIPKESILYQASLPAFNNTWDMVILRRSDSTVIDSVYYDMDWGMPGISLERRDWSQPAVSQDNLLPSESPDSATAGYKNSVAADNFDLAVKSISLNINTLSLAFILKNIGIKEISKFSLVIFVDKFGILSSENLFQEFEYKNFKKNDSLIKIITIEEINEFTKASGNFIMTAIVNSSSDIKYYNDTLKAKIYIPYSEGTISINEFMYDVSPGNAEFVELFNSYTDTVTLEGWVIHDKPISKGYDSVFVDSENFKIAPNGYGVIAWDSAFFNKYPDIKGNDNIFIRKSKLNLNTNGDDIVLLDPYKIIHDSLTYSNDWHKESLDSTKDISLEKINPILPSILKSSWTSSIATEGSTPAKENEYAGFVDTTGTLTANPNPFSPYSAGKDKYCIIYYDFPAKQLKFSAKIFDTGGNLVRNIVSSEITSSKGSLVWDGKNDDGFDLQIGPYVLFLKAVDNSTGKEYQKKMLLVIGK